MIQNYYKICLFNDGSAFYLFHEYLSQDIGLSHYENGNWNHIYVYFDFAF